MKVSECMCDEVCCVKPDCKVGEVAKLMCQNHIGCIPVCDNNKSIVGIVTDRDIILRSIACDKDVKQTPISEIMTCDVCTCDCNDEIYTAENKMAEHQIRRIPVMENNKIVGILTMGDLAHYNKQLGKEQVCTTIENICECKNQTKNYE